MKELAIFIFKSNFENIPVPFRPPIPEYTRIKYY